MHQVGTSFCEQITGRAYQAISSMANKWSCSVFFRFL